MSVINHVVEDTRKISIQEEESAIPCECTNESSTFFQNHGCCEYCYYIG